VFARFTTVHGDPSRIDPVIGQVDGEIRERVETTSGNRGFALLTDLPGGRLIGASYWEDAEALRDSEGTLAGSRATAATGLGGHLSVEHFELALSFRHSFPGRGAVVRLTRCQIDPARSEEGIVLTQEEIMPRMKGAPGLCSYQLLVDRRSGAALIVTAWEHAADAEAFAPVAEQLRARATDRVGIMFDRPETWTMVRSTVQLD
jgi:quinol monooxygenase YgiN